MALDTLTGDLLKVQSFFFVPVCPSGNGSIVIKCLKKEKKKQVGKEGAKEVRKTRRK
jgi:hypothetical protein